MPVSSVDFRRALGAWPSGVTVVTVPATADHPQPHGITVSAFVSVSLDPPLILVSIGNAASAHGRISSARNFTVSVLAVGQDDVSNRFAGRPVDGPSPLRPDGAVQGALAVLRCALHEAVVAGDHTLFLGLVEAVEVGEGAPLVYWRGKYRGVTD